MTVFSATFGGALGYLMNTTKGIIIGAAIGLTVAIWVIAYLMIRHIPPPPGIQLQDQTETEKIDRNVSATPTVTPSLEQKQDETIKQQRDEKRLINNQPQNPKEQTKPSQNPPAEEKKEAPDNVPKYEVTLIIPSHLSNADITVDGKPAVIIDRQLSVIRILVEHKGQPTSILLRKGEQQCSQTLLIQKNMRLTPCV